MGNLMPMKKSSWNNHLDLRCMTTLYCLQLFRSIYGLKQASRKWYDIICLTFAELGFEKSKVDPTVFFIHSRNDLVLLAIHVDDCTITGNSKLIIAELKI